MRNALMLSLLAFGVFAGCFGDSSGTDSDNDGLTDSQELDLGTDRQVADTDADGLNDGGEVKQGTNPTNPDTDMDNTSDGDEIANSTDPLDPLSGYTVPPVPTVDATDLLARHAEFVSENPIRKNNGAGHESARVDLTAYCESFGLEAYRHNFTAGIDQANMVCIKWGIDRLNWVVVGGHYDTTTFVGFDESNSQGAYDDGSGTMITFHLAKIFANITPHYTMAFVGLDGEERGLQGATAFVQDFHESPDNPYGNTQVVAAVNLDMIGLNWPGVMAPVNVLSNSNKAIEVADTKRKAMNWPDEQWLVKDGLSLGSSDYAKFGQQGIPTIFFISDFEEMGVPGVPAHQVSTPIGVYPFWHNRDTLESMTLMAGSAENVRLGFQSITEVVAQILHTMAFEKDVKFDGAVKWTN